MVVCLGVVHSFCAVWDDVVSVLKRNEAARIVVAERTEMGSDSLFPGKVSQQTEDWEDEAHDPEDGRGEETGGNAVIFGGEVKFWCDGGIDGDECHPDDHGAWNGENGIFRPDVRY